MKITVASMILSVVLVGCGGGSSTPDPTPKPVVKPLSILPSSYENKVQAAAALGPQNLPLDWKPCGDRYDCGSYVAPAIAFSDFMRDGTYSMVTHTMEYNSVNPLDSNRLGHIKFYQSVNGTWVDNTSKILKPDQTTGCLHAGKAIVADFLQNGMPSVFFVCLGFDGQGNTGEKQRMLLGQRDGTYKNVELPIQCMCSSASAADINNDGYPDIILTDTYKSYGIYVLLNNKDGTFSVDYQRLPNEILHKALFVVELIDFNNDGKYDVVTGGVEECCGGVDTPVIIYRNNGSGIFTNSIVVPPVKGYGMLLDVVYDNGYLYIARTVDTQDPTCFYSSFVIQRVNLSTSESVVLFESNKNVTIISSIIPYKNQIVGLSLNDKLTVGK